MTRVFTPTLLLPLALLGCDNADPVASNTSWSEARTPCAEQSDANVHSDPDGTTWCGCGDEPGLYAKGEGEAEFSAVSGFEGTSVHDFSVRSDGMLFVAGEEGGNQVILGLSGDLLDLQIETFLDVGALIDIGTAADLAVESDGEIRAMNPSGTTMAWYDGLVWFETDAWTEDPMDDGHTMVSLRSDGDVSFGVGSDGNGRPTVYLPSAGMVDYPFEAVTFATADIRFTDISRVNGNAMLAIGETVSTGGPSLLECTSDCADSASWSEVTPEASFDETHGALTRVAFDTTGQVGIAIGELQTDGGVQGYALLTADGGLNWDVVEEDFPKLDSCSVANDAFVVTGEGGFMATGELR